tara:strand:+ start:263 stop:460 length:198 start_codon:yes stop_codon:yes gene_type:complete
MMRYLGLIVAVLFLNQCSTAKQTGSAMGDFFKAIGSGDTSLLKKWKKKAGEPDEESWEEIKLKAD